MGRRLLFLALLVFSLVMPSDWTQDVPARYGRRHAGLVHSWLYPEIDTSPQGAERKPALEHPPNQAPEDPARNPADLQS